jgi:sugar O-acyltransferase (sialic acid O-acetyltransferase NeuD family)
VSRLIIFGAGGFGRELFTAARTQEREVRLMSDTPAPNFAGLAVLSPSDLLPDDEVVIGIADGEIRRTIAARCHRFGKLIAPTAIIGYEVELGEGAVFCDFTMVTASARIGRHFHCNTSSGVAHDCVIGDFVTFAGGVRCNGNVRIGDGVYVGANAVLRNGTPERPLIIGEGAIIGMGTVVVRNVPPYTTVFGNPARRMPRLVKPSGFPAGEIDEPPDHIRRA